MYDAFNFPHSRTYDSDLGWLVHVVKGMQQDYKILSEKVSKMEAAYDSIDPKIQAAIAEMQKQVNESITKMQDDVNAALKAMEDSVNRKLDEIQIQIDALIEEVHKELANALILLNKMEQMVIDYYNASKSYTDKKIYDLKNELISYIDEKILEYSGKMVSMSPVFGKVEQTDKVLKDIYDYCGWPIKANILDYIEISAKEVEDLRIPAREFDTKAGIILKKWWERKNNVHKIANPFTGKMERHKYIIASMTDFMQVGIGMATVSQIDNSGITAQELDNLGITAHEMDWVSGWLKKWEEEKIEKP